MFLNVYTITICLVYLIFVTGFAVKIGMVIRKYRFTTLVELREMMVKDDRQKIKKYFRYLGLSLLIFFMLAFIWAEITAPPA